MVEIEKDIICSCNSLAKDGEKMERTDRIAGEIQRNIDIIRNNIKDQEFHKWFR